MTSRRFIFWLLLTILLLSHAANAQPVQRSPLITGTPPGGVGAACKDTQHAYLTATGQLVTCVSSVWTAASTSAGTSVNVNGASVSSPNFNATTPAAEAGYQNAKIQVSGSSVSIEAPTPAYLGAVNAIGDPGATETISCANGTVQTMTLSADLTVSFTQPSGAGCLVRLGITQNASAAKTVAWTSVKWPGGIAPIMTATLSAIDWYSCLLDGTNTYCTAGQDFK